MFIKMSGFAHKMTGYYWTHTDNKTSVQKPPSIAKSSSLYLFGTIERTERFKDYESNNEKE